MSEDGKRLYVHLMAYPFGKLAIKGLSGKIKNASFLHDGSELLYSEKRGYSEAPYYDGMADEDGWVFIKLPVVKPNVVIPVIEINLK
jgi:alpha-L-fucosidase